MAFLSEEQIETELTRAFAELGVPLLLGVEIGPDGAQAERKSYGDVILEGRLRAAIDRLNPEIPAGAREDAIVRALASDTPDLIQENQRLHRFLVEGVPVEFHGEDGTIQGDRVRLLDFANPDGNDWALVRQFTVIENGADRRADAVLFVNGMPLAVIEIKRPDSGAEGLSEAYRQLQTYKAEVPALFRTNAALVTTTGLLARIGSLTAPEGRMMPWRTVDGKTTAPPGSVEMQTLIYGVFAKQRFLRLLRDFTVFRHDGRDLSKILAGYHQYHAVLHAVERTVEATRPTGDRKVGVIWHTQGSGKSLLMAFYAGRLVRSAELENPTIVVITDRNDLDDQLYRTFSDCIDLLRQTPEQAESREDLQEKLRRKSGGVVFATIQKFAPAENESAVPLLSDRRNIVVIADEAHRSQYGFKAKLNRKSGEITYGFAKHLRDALPNAAFIGFTGTPIEQSDVSTPAVFGDYIDVYDITRAVQDGATVPIYYESRLARIELPEDEKPKIDAEIEDLTEDAEALEQERLKQKWARVEALVGAEKRLKLVAEDIVDHFERRAEAYPGKGMIVCMSRRICTALYDAIVALRPDWHSDDEQQGAIKVIMTGSAADPDAMRRHVRSKGARDRIANRLRDPDDPLRLVIVRDMWLTGFDAPPLHTMYVDKPMRGHGLMQAIARVNRVFRDKQGGLVVDYIGLAQNLKQALANYSESDQRQAGVDAADAEALLREKYEVVRDMFHGFDYQSGVQGGAAERLRALAASVQRILDQQHEATRRAESEEDKKRAMRRFPDAVLALSRAFSLAAASDFAREVRDEVAFFQAIRAALVNSLESGGRSAGERDFAVQQLVNNAVYPTGIVDILAAAGMERPDLSVLSDEFLQDIQNLEHKNLALEALRKLLNDQIRSQARSNLVEARRFSERLEQAIARYHNNAITSVQVIQELIQVARETREALKRGEELGLSVEEIAFYDALADNESAIQLMGNDELKSIALLLVKEIKGAVAVDWTRRESARADIRRRVKRLLRKHGYPPDLQDAAVQGVLRQAESFAAKWAAA